MQNSPDISDWRGECERQRVGERDGAHEPVGGRAEEARMSSAPNLEPSAGGATAAGAEGTSAAGEHHEAQHVERDSQPAHERHRVQVHGVLEAAVQTRFAAANRSWCWCRRRYWECWGERCYRSVQSSTVPRDSWSIQMALYEIPVVAKETRSWIWCAWARIWICRLR